ncbi:hypothetical protein [Leifsonia sp. NPDC080035]|uniref:DUF5134 domain-containing protein n=1 Tax=Leifsonia sp. NPDC080035 TaxID=3143936 RepID=A0AAU7G6R7_9MICO
MTVAAPHPAAVARATARARTARSVVLPLLSLAATADMVAPGGTRVPAPLWAVLLFAAAAVVAARGRARGASHRAVEPAGMALMMVLHALHAASAAGSAAASAGVAPAGHAHGGAGWVESAIALAVAVLAVACLFCAAADSRASGLRRSLLPIVSAGAMAAMTVWMLLGVA